MEWESKGNPNAIGDRKIEYMQDGELYGFSVGLFQIRQLPGRPKQAWLMDPESNVKYASEILNRRPSWCDWTGARKLHIAKGCK